MFLLLLLTLLALDLLWLSFRQVYHETLFYSIQKSPLRMNVPAAAIVYIILAYMLQRYALDNATSWREAALQGATVGGLMYAFYDATNKATLSQFTWYMAVTDALWGAFAGGASCAIVYAMTHA